MKAFHFSALIQRERIIDNIVIRSRGWQSGALMLLAPDLPGHGKPYPINWSAVTSLHVYAEFLFELCLLLELERPVVLGCSIGGDISLDFAANHSLELRACISQEGAARTPTFPDTKGIMEPHAAMGGWESIREYAPAASLGPGCSAEQAEELGWIHKGCSQRVMASDLIGWNAHDVRDKLQNISIPTLLIRGTADFYVPAEIVDETERAIKGAEQVVMDGVGHYPMYERPVEFNELVPEFLRRHDVIQ
ncbi:MAG: alpha/beta fold hydrolase [Pseudonocardiaceae bacterium]|nr:alpha/beta fold hydrolase [Pseudonocardiaceae bacterium]